MRLRQLECFIRTCELGSISRAAEQLNVAQPALGLQIKNLEHDFGVTLLVRSSRGVSPTPAGEILLEWARDVIQRTRDVKEQLRAIARADTAVLSLGLTPSITYLLAGAILEEASRRVPGLTLRIIEGLSHVVTDWVETDKVDLALVTGASEKRTLSQTPIMREQLFFVSAARNSDRSSIPLVEVLAQPLAMPGDNDALRGIVEAEARRIDVPLTVAFEISSIPAIKDLTARGVANAVLPYGAVRREVRAGELVARPIVDPVLSRTLFLVRSHGREVGKHERQLVPVIKDCLATIIDDETAAQAYELLGA
jgi:LysR family nitrogen assimilation transcriptional regulator